MRRQLQSSPSTIPLQKRARRRALQLELPVRKRGGKRKGAGRKPTRPGSTPHLRRPELAPRFPVHVTLKVDPNLPSLRDSELLEVVEESFRRGKERPGFRLVHYSIQNDHLHLIVEADGARQLTGGVKGLCVRIARGINRTLGRKGPVFVDRYFARILKSPHQVKNGLAFVLNNSHRHAAQRRERVAPGWIDDRSSGRTFDGWQGVRLTSPPDEPPLVVKARTWLLARGWKLCGLIDVKQRAWRPDLTGGSR